jgi:SAM-dependent methyltransferase
MADFELLDAILREASAAGFLGPGPVSAARDHARRYDAALGPANAVLDLGSGGGVPGLVLAVVRPSASVTLLDASQTRTDFLRRAVGRLGLGRRVTVVTARAEDAGHRPALRGRFDAVTARGFGSPSRTAECGAGFLRLNGRLVVSDPPDPPPARWPEAGLALLGLARTEAPPGLATFVLRSPCPGRFPRRRPRRGVFDLVSRETSGS